MAFEVFDSFSEVDETGRKGVPGIGAGGSLVCISILARPSWPGGSRRWRRPCQCHQAHRHGVADLPGGPPPVAMELAGLFPVESHGPGRLPVLQHAESVASSGDGSMNTRLIGSLPLSSSAVAMA